MNVSDLCSPRVSISTGAPHGCVLSPFLYTMYTNSYRRAYSNSHCFKYGDDTGFVGLLSNDETDYRRDVDHIVSWCVAICLELSVIKTKEIVTYFRSGVHHPNSLNINGQNIVCVLIHVWVQQAMTTSDDKKITFF